MNTNILVEKPMSAYEILSIVIQALVAIGTIVVAIVAVWGDSIRAAFLSPQLTLHLRDSRGDFNHQNNGVAVRYYHLDVINLRRTFPARNVTIYLVGAYRPGPDGNWQPKFPHGPIPLTWQFGFPVFSIGPARVCDLGHITEGGDFVVELVVTPNNFDGTVKRGEHLLLEIMAVAENALEARLKIEIAWDGQWHEGAAEMENHLIVKESNQAV